MGRSGMSLWLHWKLTRFPLVPPDEEEALHQGKLVFGLSGVCSLQVTCVPKGETTGKGGVELIFFAPLRRQMGIMKLQGSVSRLLGQCQGSSHEVGCRGGLLGKKINLGCGFQWCVVVCSPGSNSALPKASQAPRQYGFANGVKIKAKCYP